MIYILSNYHRYTHTIAPRRYSCTDPSITTTLAHINLSKSQGFACQDSSRSATRRFSARGPAGAWDFHQERRCSAASRYPGHVLHVCEYIPESTSTCNDLYMYTYMSISVHIYICYSYIYIYNSRKVSGSKFSIWDYAGLPSRTVSGAMEVGSSGIIHLEAVKEGRRPMELGFLDTSTPQLPFKRPQRPSNRDHQALN